MATTERHWFEQYNRTEFCKFPLSATPGHRCGQPRDAAIHRLPTANEPHEKRGCRMCGEVDQHSLLCPLDKAGTEAGKLSPALDSERDHRSSGTEGELTLEEAAKRGNYCPRCRMVSFNPNPVGAFCACGDEAWEDCCADQECSSCKMPFQVPTPPAPEAAETCQWVSKSEGGHNYGVYLTACGGTVPFGMKLPNQRYCHCCGKVISNER